MSRRTHKTLLALSLLPLIAACQPADAPQGTAAPSASPDTAPAPADNAAFPTDVSPAGDAVTTFLNSIYGPRAKVAGEWTGVPADASFHAKEGEASDGAVTRRVCEQETTEYNGQPAVLLAVCGIPKDFGHPTPGITDFFLLQGQPLASVAKAHLQQFGSMGSVGEIDSERFGANLPGFIVEGGFTGQGHTEVKQTLLLPKDGGFHEAASFLSALHDNVLREGCKGDSAICPPGKAYDIEFDLDIDDGNKSATAYPLTVHEEGKACGKSVDTRHTLTLDSATLKYNVPAALRRELACEVPAS